MIERGGGEQVAGMHEGTGSLAPLFTVCTQEPSPAITNACSPIAKLPIVEYLPLEKNHP
jgi:hypothetical protein